MNILAIQINAEEKLKVKERLKKVYYFNWRVQDFTRIHICVTE